MRRSRPLAEFIPHSDKQERAIFSEHNITLCGAGIQWGKSRVGAVRMKMAIHTHTAPDDTFIVCAPTYKIMNQSTLPAFKSLFLDYWDDHYNDSKGEFHMPGGGTVYFRTGKDPDSIVGVTNVRHIWGDEAGKFSLAFWGNIQDRAAFKNCPITLTTSPYALNWLYKEIIKPKKRDPNARPDVLYIKARSDENPHFPAAVYAKRKETMDPRRFNMVYGGEFGQMEGLVYDCFDEVENICDPCTLPAGTRFVAGVDWGYSHPFVIAVRAVTPDGRHFQVDEFYQTQLTPEMKLDAAKRLKAIYGIEIFYCDPAQPADIASFNAGGCPAVGAVNDIDFGVQKHYELIKARRYLVFRGRCPNTEDEYSVYHYPEPNDDRDADKDDKESGPVDSDNHSMDANRYATVELLAGGKTKRPYVPNEKPKTLDVHAETKRLMRGPKGNQTESWD